MLPRTALAYLWLVVLAAGGALVAAWGGGAAAAAGQSAGLAALLFLLALLANLFPLHVAPGRKMTVAMAVYFAGLLLLEPPLTLALVASGQVVGGVLRRVRSVPGTAGTAGGAKEVAQRLMRAAPEIAFNAAQGILAFGLGGVVYASLAPRSGAALDRLESVWAVPVAAVTAYLANSLLVAGMIALQRHKSLPSVWLPGRRADALQVVSLYATGLVAALTASHYPWALMLMVLPAGMIYVSLKRTVELAEQAQVQLETLQQLSAQREELAKQMAEAEALHELDRTKNELITTISHELRTPITVIHGYAQMLKARHGVIEPKRMESLAQAVYVNSAQLQRLVQDLVDVGRVERGAFTLEVEAFNIASVLRDAVTGLQTRAGGDRVTYESEESITIVADRTRVVQVASNLVDNAMKYAPNGPIHVRVQRRGGRVRVEVEDSGPGVPSEEQARVWEKFFRGTEVVRHNLQRGTGIGLALVKALVEAQGGKVGLEDAPSGGALFWFELPSGGAQASATGAPGVLTQMTATALRVA